MFFFEELITAYPDAKVILSMRDTDSWYDSMIKTVVLMQRSKVLDCLQPFDSVLLGHFIPMMKIPWSAWLEGKEFEQIGKQKFRAQYELVRRMVSKERLLEYRVGEGWERLCEFLDVPVPDYDFPLANEQEAFGDRFQVMIGMAVQRCLIKCCRFWEALSLWV